MLTTISFNNKSLLNADKIYYIWSYLMLTSEFAVFQLSIAQIFPQKPFRIGHGFSKTRAQDIVMPFTPHASRLRPHPIRTNLSRGTFLIAPISLAIS